MEWLELKIDTSPSGLDAVTELLEQQGITGVIIDDEADFKDFLEHNKQYWDYVDEELLREKAGVSRVTFYLERNEAALHTIAQVRIAMSELKKAHPDYAPLRLTIDNVADADWENNWKKFYKPMEIGDRLLVVPQWEQAKRDHGRVKLVLNPGLTFGTGSHATTRLCLQALDKCIHGGEKILDLGCGSGILSIAALVLGAKDAFACDIDEKCVDVAYENAALNGVGKDRYTVRWGDVLTDKTLQAEFGGGYDMVVANIVADVIMGLSDKVHPFLKEGGLFLCSGIIDDRAEEVLAKLRADGWMVLEQTHAAGGHSGLGRKPQQTSPGRTPGAVFALFLSVLSGYGAVHELGPHLDTHRVAHGAGYIRHIRFYGRGAHHAPYRTAAAVDQYRHTVGAQQPPPGVQHPPQPIP